MTKPEDMVVAKHPRPNLRKRRKRNRGTKILDDMTFLQRTDLRYFVHCDCDQCQRIFHKLSLTISGR